MTNVQIISCQRRKLCLYSHIYYPHNSGIRPSDILDLIVKQASQTDSPWQLCLAKGLPLRQKLKLASAKGQAS